ncbi:MAG: class I SAM-dependent methyltransferase [Thermoanaerobaculia bacterium]
MIDEAKLNQFIGKFVNDLGATIHAGTVVLGHELGLYKAMAASGPATADALAATTKTDPRYLREWLNAQVASGYAEYIADSNEYTLNEEQAFALTDEKGMAYLPGAFLLATSALRSVPHIADAFRSGKGFGWHEHHEGLFRGTELFFRPGYAANLISSWIPALDGVAAKLTAGGKVADVGCGLGASTILMAQAFPASTFVGYDYHEGSLAIARERAREAGVAERVRFERATAKDFPGQGLDLVTFFDCLHDMGDPAGAAGHVKKSLAAEGTWMIVEPFAGDTVEENTNPVGRIYYSASTLICTPASRSQEVGAALGAQAGQKRIGEVVAQGGFSRFRRAAETPFNLIFEARA